MIDKIADQPNCIDNQVIMAVKDTTKMKIGTLDGI